MVREYNEKNNFVDEWQRVITELKKITDRYVRRILNDIPKKMSEMLV